MIFAVIGAFLAGAYSLIVAILVYREALFRSVCLRFPEECPTCHEGRYATVYQAATQHCTYPKRVKYVALSRTWFCGYATRAMTDGKSPVVQTGICDHVGKRYISPKEVHPDHMVMQ